MKLGGTPFGLGAGVAITGSTSATAREGKRLGVNCVSLEMLGGERIPPPLPPRSALAEQEKERERKQIAPWAVGKPRRMGRLCRDRVGH